MEQYDFYGYTVGSLIIGVVTGLVGSKLKCRSITSVSKTAAESEPILVASNIDELIQHRWENTQRGATWVTNDGILKITLEMQRRHPFGYNVLFTINGLHTRFAYQLEMLNVQSPRLAIYEFQKKLLKTITPLSPAYVELRTNDLRNVIAYGTTEEYREEICGQEKRRGRYYDNLLYS